MLCPRNSQLISTMNSQLLFWAGCRHGLCWGHRFSTYTTESVGWQFLFFPSEIAHKIQRPLCGLSEDDAQKYRYVYDHWSHLGGKKTNQTKIRIREKMEESTLKIRSAVAI